MAQTDDKVMRLVQSELEKNPDATVDELYEKAEKEDPSVGKLTRRQFNARYPLQVKRRMKGAKGGRKKGRTAPRATRGRRTRGGDGAGRESVRRIFLRFASDLAGAEDRKDVVEVVAGVDRYVDEALKAAGKG